MTGTSLARRGPGRRHHHGDAVEQWARLDEPGRDEWQRPQLVVATAGITDGQVVADIGPVRATSRRI